MTALMTRSPACRLLQPYRQCVVYGTKPRANNSAKLDKFPIDPRTGYRQKGWNRPSEWHDFDQAFRIASRYPNHWGVGLVVTEWDNLNFLDMDGCIENGHWKPGAAELLAMLPGAYKELSLSGTGAHAIYPVSGIQDHQDSIDYMDFRLELFSRRHFCALTGNCFDDIGNLTLPDLSAPGRQIAALFPARSKTPEIDVTWNNMSVLPPRGPTDPDELVRRILNGDT